MSYGKRDFKYNSRQMRDIGKSCPFVEDCPRDLTLRNDCTQYEKCPQLLKLIGQEEEKI